MLQSSVVPTVYSLCALAAALVAAALCLHFLSANQRGAAIVRVAFWLLLAALSAGMQMRKAVLESPWIEGSPCATAPGHCDLRAEVEVVGLPSEDSDRLRFDARVLRMVDDAQQSNAWQGRKLHLSWYAGFQSLKPGDRLRVDLRLRQPRSQVNPGGFDFERYALISRVAAVGYVRSLQQTLQPAKPGLDLWRWQIAERIDQMAGTESARFVRALTVGDTRGLSETDWTVLRKSGLSHLLAISGLHIGLLAGFGALSAQAVRRIVPSGVPRPLWSAVGAMCFALPYACLAGLGLPIQRALIMLLVVLLSVLARRRVHPWQSVGLALWIMAMFDPLALLGAGFWLSFAGVFWLMLCLPQTPDSAWRWARSLVQAQWILALGLLPLGVLFFAQTSWVAAPLNLLAVPLVGFVVVPLALLCVVALPVPALSSALFGIADWLIGRCWPAVEWTAALPGATSVWPEPTITTLCLALLGVAILLLPRGFPWRPTGVLLLLPLAWPQGEHLEANEVRVRMFDVGQGLSVWIGTQHHSLLYDSGPAFRSGGDAAERNVIPALLAQQREAPDLVLISHGDADHSGGWPSLTEYYGQLPSMSGEPNRTRIRPVCQAGMRWRWDEVDFEILHPTANFPEMGNDSSCVLRVAAGAHALLIPGDISETIEARLVNRVASQLHSDVLLVPHHGSKYSSGDPFLSAVAPRYALISAGADNSFGHPAPETLARLESRQVQVLSTAQAGAVEVSFGNRRDLHIGSERAARPRFWRAASEPSRTESEGADLPQRVTLRDARPAGTMED